MKKIFLFIMVLLCFALLSCGKHQSNEKVFYNEPSNEKIDETYLDTLALQKCQHLYETLLSFIHDNEFQKAGLAGKQEYIDWTNEVNDFVKSKEAKRILKSGIIAGDLRTLADQYVFSHGNETKETKSLRIHFEAAFAPNPDFIDDNTPINAKADKNVIGKWKVDSKYVPEAGFDIEIYELDGLYFALMQFLDGSSSTERLRKDGSKYHIMGNNNHEYYMIKSGMLRICGLDGDFTEEVGYRVTKK